LLKGNYTSTINTTIEIHLMEVTEAVDTKITANEIHLMEVTEAVDTKITANEIHVMK